MDNFQAQSNEQASTEIVDELRDRNICKKCGQQIVIVMVSGIKEYEGLTDIGCICEEELR